MTKKSGGGLRTTTSTTTTELPLNPVEFPFYYEDYGEVAYNYDDQAYVDHDGDGIPNVLPIINHRREQQQKSPFLPTPLPQTSTSETLVTADPLPLTTMKVETTTTSTTTTTSAPTTILGSYPLLIIIIYFGIRSIVDFGEAKKVVNILIDFRPNLIYF